MKIDIANGTATLTVSVEVAALLAQEGVDRRDVMRGIWDRLNQSVTDGFESWMEGKTNAEIDADNDLSPNRKSKLKANRIDGNAESEIAKVIPSR